MSAVVKIWQSHCRRCGFTGRTWVDVVQRGLTALWILAVVGVALYAMWADVNIAEQTSVLIGGATIVVLTLGLPPLLRRFARCPECKASAKSLEQVLDKA